MEFQYERDGSTLVIQSPITLDRNNSDEFYSAVQEVLTVRP